MAAIDVEQVTQEYFARIHRAALVLTGNPWDADDLAQETFLVLARQSDKFKGRSSIFTWLYGILLNLDRRQRRRHGIRRRKLQVLGQQQEPYQQTAPAASMAVEASEWKASLWSRVAKLPDGQRQCLVLRFSESMAYEDIAATLQCPLGTVKSRIFHGLHALRRLMQSEEDEVRHPPQYPDEDVHRAI